MEGLVYKSTGSWYIIKDAQGQFRNARIKGKLKIDEEISSTNPIAVGDSVLYEEENNDDAHCIIYSIKKRHNYIIRVSPHNKNQKHIVAANLDLALIIATISEPRTSQGFIDRFLITAEAYHIPCIIVINKTDLLKPKHLIQLKHWQEMYEKAGYPVFAISALDAASMTSLKEQLKDRTTLFSGHSGVGKSTLINNLIPDAALKTSAVSEWSGKGLHTTTFAEMFDLSFGGRIIDTPGVKEFGLVDIEKEELAHYFPEMRAVMNECQFNNCLHINEPGCAVKKGVNEGSIEADRYISYVTILDTIEKKW